MTSVPPLQLERVAKAAIFLVGLVFFSSSVYALTFVPIDTPIAVLVNISIPIVIITALLVGLRWWASRHGDIITKWLVPLVWGTLVGILIWISQLVLSFVPISVAERPFDRAVWAEGCTSSRHRLEMFTDLHSKLTVGTTTRDSVTTLLGEPPKIIEFSTDLNTDLPTPTTTEQPQTNPIHYCLGKEPRLFPIDTRFLVLTFDDQGVLTELHESAY